MAILKFRAYFLGQLTDDESAAVELNIISDASLEDKLLILRAQKAEGLPETHEERDTWAAEISDEVPAFAAFLLSYRAPENVKLDSRTRVPKT